MATDPVVEYWAEIMKRSPVTPDMMVQWKRILDHSLDAWSRALSEVMATEEFAQLLGATIEQWIAAQAPFAGKAAPLAGQPDELMALAAQMSRLEERLQQIEERIASTAEPSASAPSASDSDSARTARRRRRRAA